MITNVAAALRLFGSSNAGTPFDTASTPVSAVQPDANARRKQEDDQHAAGVGDIAKLIARALRAEPVAEQDLDGRRRRASRRRRRRSRRSARRRRARTPDPAQVRHHEDDHESERQLDRVRGEARHGARDRGHSGDDRDGDREHVVDQKRRGRGQGRVLAEVGTADRVGTAAVWIGLAGLAIGGDHDRKQQHDGGRDPRRQVEQRETAETQHEHDLLGRIGDG